MNSYIAEQLKPTLHTTFKSSGWLERRNTQEGIENAATKDELSEAEESLITTFNVSVEETAESILSTVGTTVSDLEGELRSFVGTEIEQTARGFEQSITRLETGLDGKATTTQFNTLTSTVNGTITRVGNAEGNITQIESQLSVMNNQINARVEKGEVMSQINIEAGRTLIQSDRLYLDANSVVFSGSAFIPNAAIESLSADKLTAGTLTGANMTLDLNEGVLTSTSRVNNQLAGMMTIRSGQLESVSNLGSGRLMTLSGDRLHLSDDDGYVELTPRYIDFNANNRTARLRFNGANFVFDTNLGMSRNHINSVDWIRIIGQEGDTMDTSIFNSPNHPGSILADTRQITIGLGSQEEISRIASFSGNIQFMRNLFMQGNNISNVERLGLDRSTTEMLTASDNASGVLRSGQRLILGIRTGSAIANTSSRIIITGRIDMQRNVWMNGNTMYGQVGNESDRRLKKGIEEAKQDSLDIIRRLNFVEYEWIDKEKYGHERKFGLIAQEVDDCLSLYDEDSDIYSINSSQVPLVNSHAIQQLAKGHENTLLVASHAYLLAEQHEDEITQLRRKVKEIEQKLEEVA